MLSKFHVFYTRGSKRTLASNQAAKHCHGSAASPALAGDGGPDLGDEILVPHGCADVFSVAGMECDSTRAPEIDAELIGRGASQALVPAAVGALLVDLEGDLWRCHPGLHPPWSTAGRTSRAVSTSGVQCTQVRLGPAAVRTRDRWPWRACLTHRTSHLSVTLPPCADRVPDVVPPVALLMPPWSLQLQGVEAPVFRAEAPSEPHNFSATTEHLHKICLPPTQRSSAVWTASKP